MKIDYELVEKVGATHYDAINGDLYKLSDATILVYSPSIWCKQDVADFSYIIDNVKPIPQKPTRTEYVKVTDSIFDLKDEFERCELYFMRGNGDYSVVECADELVKVFVNENLCRRIEKEVDWRDEVIAFRDSCKSGGDNLLPDYFSEYMAKEDWHFMRSDDFLEMCRVALRANGELK